MIQQKLSHKKQKISIFEIKNGVIFLFGKLIFFMETSYLEISRLILFTIIGSAYTFNPSACKLSSKRSAMVQ